MRTEQQKDRRAFEKTDHGKWREVLNDPCTGDWTERWFLDGEVGTVKTGADGMALTAVPEIKNNAHRCVEMPCRRRNPLGLGAEDWELSPPGGKG